MKNLSALLVVAVLVLLLFTGCTKKNKPAVSESVESSASQAQNVNPDEVVPVSDHEEIISAEEAKLIALNSVGVADEYGHYKSELDRESSSWVYEIEFISGRYEFEIEVSAIDGKILKSEKEIKD